MTTKLIVIPLPELKQIMREAYLEHEAFKRIEQEQQKKRETLFSVNEVAKKLSRAHNTIKKLVAQGLIKTTPDGMISEKSLNDYLMNE